ncbi:MAG: hypothetical protein EWV49_11315 [Microcystis aeruginosa Ma_QC_Ch_20071001_S25]|nr:MAG: hypothetical protein EWV49_11315 [Microcystis aeruginosa Ma_QC_Ch_20071001_S25]
MSYATYGIIRNETLIEKDIWRFLSIVFDLERTNQLSLCHPIEPYQVTKNRISYSFLSFVPCLCSEMECLIVN